LVIVNVCQPAAARCHRAPQDPVVTEMAPAAAVPALAEHPARAVARAPAVAVSATPARRRGRGRGAGRGGAGRGGRKADRAPRRSHCTVINQHDKDQAERRKGTAPNVN
jgi:hypothetical protein